jgi:DNA-binding NtrC family response regulator
MRSPISREAEVRSRRDSWLSAAPAVILGAVAQIVLVGRDWKTRALVRAQLLEEGLDAEAFQSIDEAQDAVEATYPPPRLIVADLSSSAEPGAEIERLAQWSREIPVWILGSRIAGAAPDWERRGFERLWFKPIDVGELVREIKRRVQSGAGDPHRP